MPAAFAQNPAYIKYERLLLQLHDLIAEGEGDSDVADEIRDRMDEPYYNMTPAEQERLGSLSTDVYRMQEEVAAVQMGNEAGDGEQAEDNRLSAERAFLAQDWIGLLSALRKIPIDLPAEALASLRSAAYEQLGHLEVALRFRSVAAALNPGEPGHRVSVMNILSRLRRVTEAADVARQLLAIPDLRVDLQIYASYFLIQEARRSEPERAKLLYNQAVAALAPILDRLEATNPGGAQALSMGYGILGFAYKSLSMLSLDNAVTLAPEDIAVDYQRIRQLQNTETEVDDAWEHIADAAMALAQVETGSVFGTARNRSARQSLITR